MLCDGFQSDFEHNILHLKRKMLNCIRYWLFIYNFSYHLFLELDKEVYKWDGKNNN